MTKNTIVINGKVYDAISGLPAAAPDPLPAEEKAPAAKAPTSHTAHEVHRTPTKAKSVHRHTQKSQTLRRDLLKAPAKLHHDTVRRKPAVGHVARSPHITKFAPHPKPIQRPATQHVSGDIAAPTPHPIAQRAIQKVEHRKTDGVKPAALSSRELKEHLIAERLATVERPKTHEHKAAKKSFFSSVPRASTVIAACFAVVFLGGYLTYISMPSLSMRVAASQAGVDAAYPDYHPDGYRFEGPIAYNTGEVSVRFASNTNDTGYTVKQRNSGWDSQAVLDNLVTKRSDKYLTYSEQGLTIYTYDNNAAWVNGGVLYTVEGDAPLSSEQILRIASSM